MKRKDKKLCDKIIKAIEQRNETVIHEGMFCLALDVKDGVLLWCKPTGWLGLRQDIKTYSGIQDKTIIQHRNVPIYKKNKETIHLLTPELKELLNELYK